MVFVSPGSPLEPRDIPLPPPGVGEAIVRVTCCTLCGSDLHSYLGRRPVPTPTVLGHEIVGVVESAGTGFAFAPGERVTWSVAASCGACVYCAKRVPQKCETLRKYGHEPLDIGAVGGLSTHCHLLPGTAAFRLPDSIPDAVACPASCATATIAAALRATDGVAGESVLIFGAGMLGLTAAAMARARGAEAVVVCDVDVDRLGLARRFGATHTTTPEHLGSAVGEVSSGRGVGAVLELSGAPSAVAAGLDLARVGGVLVWAGSVFPSAAVEVPPEKVVRKLLTIRGVHNYRPDDLAAALEFLERAGDRYPFEELVARTFPLEEADDAFRYAVEARPVRVAVTSTAG